jgi:uncharacterized protein YjbI with pentapeptide repeats
MDYLKVLQDRNGYNRDSVFVGVDFSKIDLRDARIAGAKFLSCSFTKAQLNGAVFTECDFYGSTFTKCNLRNATAVSCNFRSTTFRGAKLYGAVFRMCESDTLTRSNNFSRCGRGRSLNCEFREQQFSNRP